MRGVREGVSLASLTTIGLGGPARYYARCSSLAALQRVLALVARRGWPVHVLGGGSNTVFSDLGFAGLVVHVAWRGITMRRSGRQVFVCAQAGEPWDSLVRRCAVGGLAGLECLSGIPGLVGATPMQNVGAYGQQVSDTIAAVRALNRKTLTVESFSAAACNFAYRHSRFKDDDRDRYIILEVVYRLAAGGRPMLDFPQVAAAAGSAPSLVAVRRAVLTLRRRKSMVVRASDPHSRSCGSFFLNPILSQAAWRALQERYRAQGGTDEVPAYPAGHHIKVPAAWLVEHSGVRRGERRGGVGISPNHALALVNYSGTSAGLLKLAQEVGSRVERTFGIQLVREPEVVSSSGMD